MAKKTKKKPSRYEKAHRVISVHMTHAELRQLDGSVRRMKKGHPNKSRSKLLIACFKRVASRH